PTRFLTFALPPHAGGRLPPLQEAGSRLPRSDRFPRIPLSPASRADVGIGPYKGRLQKRKHPVYRTRAADCRPYKGAVYRTLICTRKDDPP
ncbi:MAG: hypothetical protein ACSW8F_04150, partial [bacterium]